MDITHEAALEKEKDVLEGKNTLLANENVELQRARDAVYTMLRSGSYLCTYAEDGESLLSMKFSDALRKLYGYFEDPFNRCGGQYNKGSEWFTGS